MSGNNKPPVTPPVAPPVSEFQQGFLAGWAARGEQSRKDRDKDDTAKPERKSHAKVPGDKPRFMAKPSDDIERPPGLGEQP